MNDERCGATTRKVDGMKRTIAILGAVALVSICAALAHATQIVIMTPRQMGEKAQLVVAGKVSATESFWNEKRTKIFTRIDFAVDASYKGSAPPVVSLLQLGGTVDGVRTSVDGAVMWKVGEEALLFVEPYTNGTYQVTGLSQGKFRIERDPATGAAYISRPALEGVKLVDETGAPAAAPVPGSAPPAAAIEKTPIERFVAEALGETKAK
jgi:hypothetical protein